jgi:hypothetical protein
MANTQEPPAKAPVQSAEPSGKPLSRAERLAEAVTVGGNSMSAMEPFGALIGAAIGGMEALEEEGKESKKPSSK